MEYFIIIGLILLNGFFSMAEMSMVAARKFKLENGEKQGNKGAKVALELQNSPTRFLSTVQIGITLIGILVGMFSSDKLSGDLTLLLQKVPYVGIFAGKLATIIILFITTFLSIVLGELVPKRIGMTFPEAIATKIAQPMQILSKIASPFVVLLSKSNELILGLMGIEKTHESRASEEEIKSMIRESADGGEIEDIEQDIVERVFEMGDRKIESLMTYRTDITYFDITDNWSIVREKITSDKHSAYPVVIDNNIDQIAGIVLLKDLFDPVIGRDLNLSEIIREPIYVNEKQSAYRLLERFKDDRIHYAIAVDEYGSTQGMVTMDDVLDALVGTATEVEQNEYQIFERDDHSWLIDGRYSYFEFAKYFDIEYDQDLADEFSTVAGLFIHFSNRLPEVGDCIQYENYQLEVIDKDGQRIDKILMHKLPE